MQHLLCLLGWHLWNDPRMQRPDRWSQLGSVVWKCKQCGHTSMVLVDVVEKLS